MTDEDAEGRRLFQKWCEDAGLTMGVDQMGTMFMRREGTDPDALPVYVGSHLDTQPTGGKYDGILGTLAGLELVRADVLEHVALPNKTGQRPPADVILLVTAEQGVASPAVFDSAKTQIDALKNRPEVDHMASYFDAKNPQLANAAGTKAFAAIGLAGDGEQTLKDYRALEEQLRVSRPDPASFRKDPS